MACAVGGGWWWWQGEVRTSKSRTELSNWIKKNVHTNPYQALLFLSTSGLEDGMDSPMATWCSAKQCFSTYKPDTAFLPIAPFLVQNKMFSGQMLPKMMNKTNYMWPKIHIEDKLWSAGSGEKEGISQLPSLGCWDAKHFVFFPKVHLSLCRVTQFHLKWVFKSVLLNCCKILCGCSSVDLILVYVDLVSCQLLLNPFETELNQLMSVLAI